MNKRLACLLISLLSLSASASTWIVTTNADRSSSGTLRWAILAAITNPGTDTIAFNLPGSLVIAPTGALPSLSDVTGGTTIDGTTQPAYTGTPLVRLDGHSAGSANGLMANGWSNVIKGLIITRFQGAGIFVLGNYTTIAGNQVVSNGGSGIVVDSARNRIGGTDPTNRNVISANSEDGIFINGPDSVQNTVQGNYIGTDVSGATSNGNGNAGILIAAPSNQIGGPATAARNVICGHTADAGIRIASYEAHHNLVEGNYIGVNAGGSTAVGNSTGIQIFGPASNNVIGGTAAGAGNIISGNHGDGISFETECRDNTVAGNYIGTDAAGALALSNGQSGVGVYKCPANVIGTGNLISGNGQWGVDVNSSTGLVICGNTIGLATNGTDLGNANDGITMWIADHAVVGGTNSSSGNVIGGNRDHGIETWYGRTNTIRFNTIGLNAAGSAVSNRLAGVYVYYEDQIELSDNVLSGNGMGGVMLQYANRCTLKRNRIGTDPTGSFSRKNNTCGIQIQYTSCNNVIGGVLTNEANVISGNSAYGIDVRDNSSTGNVIRGNLIGTDLSGTKSIANGGAGILFEDSPGNTIGSTNFEERNVISGNSGNGIEMGGTDSHDNRVIGNYIGVDITGTNALGDTAGGGVWMNTGAWSNRVGGFEAGAGNVIAYNAGGGVGVASASSCGNFIASNSIFRNGGVGIDLGNLGIPDANDTQDPDVGANHLQNYPVLLAVSNLAGGTQLQITGYLDSRPNEPFLIEFYGCTGPAPNRFGQGERPFASFGPRTADVNGILGFTNVFATPNPPPNFVTALAHHANLYDTSEFSQSVMLDTDHDGMPDGYETAYFGNYIGGDPNADADGDKVPNLAEFIGDTNPQDSNSYFRVTTVSRPGATFRLTTPGSLERGYHVEVSTNLSMGAAGWFSRTASLAYSGSDAVFTGGAATNNECYRVISIVP